MYSDFLICIDIGQSHTTKKKKTIKLMNNPEIHVLIEYNLIAY